MFTVICCWSGLQIVLALAGCIMQRQQADGIGSNPLQQYTAKCRRSNMTGSTQATQETSLCQLVVGEKSLGVTCMLVVVKPSLVPV